MKRGNSQDIDNVCETCGAEINENNKSLNESVTDEVYEGVERIRYVTTICEECFKKK